MRPVSKDSVLDGTMLRTILFSVQMPSKQAVTLLKLSDEIKAFFYMTLASLTLIFPQPSHICKSKACRQLSGLQSQGTISHHLNNQGKIRCQGGNKNPQMDPTIRSLQYLRQCHNAPGSKTIICKLGGG